MDYSLAVSQTFFEKLKKRLENESNDLTCIYSTFNSGKERGLMLNITDNGNDNELFIWAGASLDMKRIMVVVADNYSSECEVYDDKDYKLARYFDIPNYNKAVTYAYNVIKKQFPKSFKEEYNTTFKMHKSLEELKEITSNLKNLNYEDYYELATFEDVEQLYFCDLVIRNGMLGLDYSKYSDSYCNECDSLYFEKWEPDLSSDVTLMLGMKDKLKKYVEKRIDYDTKNGIGI